MKTSIRSRVPLVLLTPIVLIVALGLEVACIKKTTGTVTPWEKAASYNAAFADLNQTIEQGAEIAASGNILPKDNAAQVIDFTGRAATVHLQITAIIQKGANASPTDMASMQDLLSQISASGQVLIKSGNIGIKNPRSQQDFAQDVAALINLAQTLINLIPQLQATPHAMILSGGDSWTL